MQWQPIETAPKDGTEILSFTIHGEVEVTRWCEHTQDKYDEVGGGLYRKTTEDVGFWNSSRPTHWMPMPAPPSEA